MFRINFLLKKPSEITPWGELHPTLHWFGLTDGLLWIEIGDSVIYEYAEAHTDEKGNLIKYNDYQLSRFLEDFSEILPYVSESIPRSLYYAVESFEKDTDAWKELYADNDDETFDEFYFGDYETLTSWFYDRCLDSGHLIDGPLIGCFRCGDRIKIRWDSIRSESDNRSSIWKYPSGCVEISYSEFVPEVLRFFSTFHVKMDKQVEDVVCNGIPRVEVDTNALIRENRSRKDGFSQKTDHLTSDKESATNWKDITDLYDRMRAEIGK